MARAPNKLHSVASQEVEVGNRSWGDPSQHLESSQDRGDCCKKRKRMDIADDLSVMTNISRFPCLSNDTGIVLMITDMVMHMNKNKEKFQSLARLCAEVITVLCYQFGENNVEVTPQLNIKLESVHRILVNIHRFVKKASGENITNCPIESNLDADVSEYQRQLDEALDLFQFEPPIVQTSFRERMIKLILPQGGEARAAEGEEVICATEALMEQLNSEQPLDEIQEEWERLEGEGRLKVDEPPEKFARDLRRATLVGRAKLIAEESWQEEMEARKVAERKAMKGKERWDVESRSLEKRQETRKLDADVRAADYWGEYARLEMRSEQRRQEEGQKIDQRNLIWLELDQERDGVRRLEREKEERCRRLELEQRSWQEEAKRRFCRQDEPRFEEPNVQPTLRNPPSLVEFKEIFSENSFFRPESLRAQPEPGFLGTNGCSDQRPSESYDSFTAEPSYSSPLPLYASSSNSNSGNVANSGVSNSFNDVH